ncbi:MAG: hypothetical protein HWN80_05420 [Candidatus Lokiarchaeota archaeon]|nr:hypothetical protein [Candidatus Lokiarchaeota archaeon]
MKINSKTSFLKKTSVLRIAALIVISGIFLSSSLLIPNSNDNTEINRDFNDTPQIPLTAAVDSVLFGGSENALNITDYGNLYETEQQVDLTNQEAVNLTYYLDDVHKWEVSEVETQINNIQDERDWIDNGVIGSDTGLTPTSQVSQSEDSGPSYVKNLNPNNYLATFDGNDCDYMRIHFVLLEVEYYYDELYISNQDNTVLDNFAGYYTDFYTPWYSATELKISMSSDGTVQYYGYSVDFFETYNGSMFTLDSTSWNYFEDTIDDPSRLYGGTAEIGNRSALRTVIEGIDNAPSYSYEDGDIAGFYQNFTIPRGKLIDAWVSMDYNILRGINTNDNYAYIKVNGETVYTRGFRTITNAGLGQWHSTGLINLDLWENSSSIFDEVLIGQSFNLSVGIEIGNGVEYTGFDHLDIQEAYFDNIQLIFKTSANSTQPGINLQFNNSILNDDNTWGVSYLNLTGNWNINPLKLTVTTDSPSVSFDLDITLYGYHKTKSRVGQTTLEGVSYEILENGTIIWEFSHNFYMPAQYSDFEFTINKPENWDFLSVLDPTLQSRSFEFGNHGDLILHINKEDALYPGWWTFQASSPNYLDISNTKLLKQGEWVQTSFITGESTRIKTQVNYSDEVPIGVDSTLVNLTIYDPEGVQWFTEANFPLTNGTVTFSEITFDALNTTGGTYGYTLFWSNGTSLGGIKSNFIIEHQSTLTLLKPDDAKNEHIPLTEGFVGDIIPVRVLLSDSENNLTISNSVVSYNWTLGRTFNFTEAALGVYETILDTADLASKGLYSIVIRSSKIGFLETNFTLWINLGEETKLQRLESDYNIELHANSTIKFKFTDFSGDGIDGATVNISISDPSHYSIENIGNGVYDIEFSTLYIDDIGIYQINFSFSAPEYEPQYYVYQFQIIKQSVNLTVLLNSENIQENSLHPITFFDKINISAQAMSIIDKNNISGGTFSWTSEYYQKNFTEVPNDWYNSSVECLPENFSSGINFIYLKFEHPNYRTQTFGFELLIDRIEFEVDIVGHEDLNPTIKAEIGGSLVLQIELLDIETSLPIENATVLYEWKYGVGELEEAAPGTYQLSVGLPENLQGNFIFNLIISKEGTVYKTTQSSFLLVIGEPQFPTFIILIIILIAAIIISVLGVLSLRSYVILPRRRRREANLLSRTQRFKDVENVQAIVVIHRDSGIPLYSKSYSILEKHKKEIFSGFIQAIITVGEEMVGKRGEGGEIVELDEEDGTRTILELDFKYFYCLICDRQDLRIIFLLTNRASDRLKKQISDLSLGAMLELSDQIGNWDGAIHEFEEHFPPIVNKYIELSYKEAFTINSAEFIAKIRKEDELNSMETRILNVIYSIAKSKQEFHLETIFELIHEKNRDTVIDGIETLIKKQLIIPSTK